MRGNYQTEILCKRLRPRSMSHRRQPRYGPNRSGRRGRPYAPREFLGGCRRGVPGVYSGGHHIHPHGGVLSGQRAVGCRSRSCAKHVRFWGPQWPSGLGHGPGQSRRPTGAGGVCVCVRHGDCGAGINPRPRALLGSTDTGVGHRWISAATSTSVARLFWQTGRGYAGRVFDPHYHPGYGGWAAGCRLPLRHNGQLYVYLRTVCGVQLCCRGVFPACPPAGTASIGECSLTHPVSGGLSTLARHVVVPCHNVTSDVIAVLGG